MGSNDPDILCREVLLNPPRCLLIEFLCPPTLEMTTLHSLTIYSALFGKLLAIVDFTSCHDGLCRLSPALVFISFFLTRFLNLYAPLN